MGVLFLMYFMLENFCINMRQPGPHSQAGAVGTRAPAVIPVHLLALLCAPPVIKV